MRILFTGLRGLSGTWLSNLLLNEESFEEHIIGSVIRTKDTSYFSLSSKVLTDKEYIGSLENIDFVSKLLEDFCPDLIVHLAQIKYAPTLIKCLNKLKFNPKIIILGTTAVFSKFKCCSDIYIDSEAYIRRHYSDYIILRSSLIYGSRYDKNFNKLFNRIKNERSILITSDGLKSLYKPIYYKDIASLIYNLIINLKILKSNEYNITGPDIIQLGDIIKSISNISNKPARIIKLPYFAIKYPLQVLETIPFIEKSLPIKSEQILRLRENKISNSDISLISPEYKLTSIHKGLQMQYDEMYTNSQYTN